MAIINRSSLISLTKENPVVKEPRSKSANYLSDANFRNLIQALGKSFSAKAILCYGSYAHNMQDEKSDIDLLIFVDILPSRLKRQQIYKKTTGIKIMTLGEDKNSSESTWSLRNDSLDFQGIKIEPGFNTLRWLNKVITSLLKQHKITSMHMPFRPYTILGLIETSVVLLAKNSLITRLRKRIRPFSKKLKKAIVTQNYPLMCGHYQDLVTNSDRNIGFLAYQFQVSMFFDAVLQLLFVINDVYDPASKRAEAFLTKFQLLPKGLIEFIENVLPECYRDRAALIKQGDQIKKSIERELKKQNLN